MRNFPFGIHAVTSETTTHLIEETPSAHGGKGLVRNGVYPLAHAGSLRASVGFAEGEQEVHLHGGRKLWSGGEASMLVVMRTAEGPCCF